MRYTTVAACALAILLWGSTNALAQGKGKGKSGGSTERRAKADQTETEQKADEGKNEAQAEKRISVTSVKNGRVGAALKFDGVKSCVEIPHDDALEPEKLTLEAWVHMPEYPSGVEGRRWIAGKNDSNWSRDQGKEAK